jgi:nitrogen fixation NifU-like protein
MAVILDHFQQPRNYGELAGPDVDEEQLNPSCGDRVRVQARIGEAGRLEEVGFIGNGCVISMAAASLLTTMTEGRTLAEVVRLPEASIIDALEASISARRIDCALLAFRALRSGLISYYHANRLREKGQ